jgi:hypothetical protein
MSTLPPLTIYPATKCLLVLRNSTFRARFLLRKDGVPVDLSQEGTVIDADIKDSSGLQIASFTVELPLEEGEPIPGIFSIELTPEATLELPIATNHRWDLSITYPSGDRFYYCQGPLEVRETVSRNDES